MRLEAALWIGTWTGGVANFNGTIWTIYNTSNSPLISNNIRNIVIDRQGDKWFGLGGVGVDYGSTVGVARLSGTTWTIFTSVNSGLPNRTVGSIAIDIDDTKWFGLYYGGLVHYDGTNWSVYNTSNSSLPSNAVFSLAVDAFGVKWIGTLLGISSFDGATWTTYNTSNSGLPGNLVGDIAIDHVGLKWLGTTSGGIASFDGTTWTIYNTSNSKLPSNNVSPTNGAIAVDAMGNKWIGTQGGVGAYVIGYSLSGNIKDTSGNPSSEVLITMTNPAGTTVATATTDSSGNYTLSGLAAGSYTITPSKTGYSLSPSSLPVTITNANITGQNFTGTLNSLVYSISGRVTDGNSNGIVGVTISDGVGHTATTDSNDNYTLNGFANGTYTLTPTKDGLFFTPPTREVVVSGDMEVNFTGYPCIAPSGMNVCNLQPGDILLERSPLPPLYAAAFSIGGTYFTHAAMYLGELAAPGEGTETIMPRLAEAQGYTDNIQDQVWETSLTSHSFWSGDNLIDWAVIRPNVPDSVKEEAIQYIRDKAGPDVFLFDIWAPKWTNDRFYCSKLVWRSYLDVPGGKDLEVDVGISTILDQWVTPDDLFFSVLKGSTIVESKLGITLDRILLTLWSPAHIMLVDPSGLRTGYDPDTGTILNEIPLATYTAPPDAEVETISAIGVGDGWKVVVTGYDNGEYKLEYNYLKAGTLNIINTNSTEPGQVEEYDIEDPRFGVYLPFISR